MRAKICLFAVLLLAASSVVWSQTAMGPVLVNSDPFDGSLTNNRNQTVLLDFSLAVGTIGVAVTGPAGQVGVNVAYGADQTILIVTPTQSLADGVYTVDFSNVHGQQGYPVEGTTSISFSVDATAPRLNASSPTTGQTSVPVDTQISLTFSEAITFVGAAAPFTLTGPSGPVLLQFVSHSAETNTYVYQPMSPLALSATYSVNYSVVRDEAGNGPAPPASFTFATVSPPPLTLASSSPTNSQTGVSTAEQIVLTFSNGLDPQASSVTVTGGGVLTPGTLAVAGTTATFIPSIPYVPGVAYTVQLSGVKDIYGQSPVGQTTVSFTTVPPDPLALVSSSPANGQAGVPSNGQIVLTFNNSLAQQGSSITVTGGGLMTAGTLVIAGPTATFIPTTSYVPGVLYTVGFSGVKDVYGQSPTGLTQTTFSTAGAMLDGRADPPMVTVAAGERVGVTYFIQNLSGSAVNLRSSAAGFYVNGNLISSVSVPAESNVPANGIVAIPSDVTISEQIQSAAKAAGTDQIIMLRVFTASTPVLQEGGTSVMIPLIIRVGSSLAGPASVTEIVLDVPPDSKTVGQSDEIRGHAFIRGTGTGPVVGTWFVDGQPTETFQINLTAGLTQEVWTRLTLPTLNLGEHAVELQVGRPQPVSSGERRYVVVPKGSGSQRMFIASPTGETTLMPGNVRTSFRWVPMPGSSGYEIAFARSRNALGLDETGNVLSGPLGRMAWTAGMVASGELSLLARVSSDVLAWTPSAEEYDRLFAGSPGKIYWAVRAIYPAEGRGDPTTTSKPFSLKMQQPPENLDLVSPEEGATIAASQPSFEWQPGPEGSIYEFVILSDSGTVFTALTRECRFTLSALSAVNLQPGAYSWRVSALQPTEGVAAASARRTFTVASEPGAQAPAQPTTKFALMGQAVAITPSGVYLLPGATSQLTISPPSGAVVASQQPLISATYPEAVGGEVMISLNGVDVTALASVTPTSATLQPPGVFSQGEHTVTVVVNTTSGTQLQETSMFTVALAVGTEITSVTSGATDTQQPLATQPLQLDLNWNWRPTSQGVQGNDLVFDVNLRGEQTWLWSSDSYAAFNFQFAKPGNDKADLANFLAEASMKGGKYKASAGDIGMAESELTAQGLISRAFNFVSSAGPLRLSATHTLGKAIQRSSIGRTPDVFLVTAETSGSTPQRGLKLTYVDSQSDLMGTSSFMGPTQSRVVSLGGRTPIAKTGLNFRTEIARSDASVVSAFGSQGSKGNAITTTVDGIMAGCGIATSYRRIGSKYASPASTTLTNDIKGWAFAVNRPLGQFVSTTLNYSTYDNLPSASTPAAGLTSRSLDLTANYPKLPSIALRLARNDSFSAPFTTGGRPGDTQENVWSISSNWAGQKWNGYLTYSKSDFDDFFDYIDPSLDTPNDRSTGTWSLGFGLQPIKAFKLRADLGANATDRWLRPLLGVSPTLGSDSSRQARIQAEYLLGPKMSATMAWSNSNYADALGTYRSDFRDFNVRLNYFLGLTRGGGGVALTGEFRRYRFGGTSSGDNKGEFSILINDNRVLAF